MSEINLGIDSAVERVAKSMKAVMKREIKESVRSQLRSRYKYIVGEWRGGIRAKSTRTGRVVSVGEVISYLNNR